MRHLKKIALAALLLLAACGPSYAQSSSVSMKDGDPFTADQTRVNVAGCSTEATTVTASDASAIHCNTSGDVAIQDGGNSITVDNGGTFATQATIAAGNAAIAKAEDVASADADVGVPAMAIRQSAPANTSNSNGDWEALQMSAGRLWVDASGVSLTVASHAVTNAGTFVTQENGALLTSSQLIDDTIIVDNGGFTDGTTKTDIAGFIFDEVAGTALTENDAGAARMDSKRAMVGVIEDATTRGQRAVVSSAGALATNLAQVAGATTATGNGTASGSIRVSLASDSTGTTIATQATAANFLASVGGLAAHDAPVSGNPVLSASEARTTDGTAVTSGDSVRNLADTLGKQVTLVGSINDLRVSGTLNEADATADDIIAAVASTRIAVTHCLVTNHSATVNTKVEIRDGTTVKYIGSAYNSGGGYTIDAGGSPLFIGTSAAAITGRAVTTGADVDISCSGYKMVN